VKLYEVAVTEVEKELEIY